MKLEKAIMRPGKVKQVLENGMIKAIAPGLFGRQDELDNLPPIYPFFTGNTHEFSSVKENEEVWILNVEDSPLELFYVRKDSYDEEFQDIANKDGLEVLMSKDNGIGKARLFFNSEEGWMMQNVDAIIQMNNKGDILLKSPNRHRCIDINANNISIGTEGKSAHPAVLGDNLVDSLNMLSLILGAVGDICEVNPNTACIKAALDALLPMFDRSIDRITSGHVTLD